MKAFGIEQWARHRPCFWWLGWVTKRVTSSKGQRGGSTSGRRGYKVQGRGSKFKEEARKGLFWKVADGPKPRGKTGKLNADLRGQPPGQGNRSNGLSRNSLGVSKSQCWRWAGQGRPAGDTRPGPVGSARSIPQENYSAWSWRVRKRFCSLAYLYYILATCSSRSFGFIAIYRHYFLSTQLLVGIYSSGVWLYDGCPNILIIACLFTN